MVKILYVTDLDGTLLNSKDKLSEYTIVYTQQLGKERKWRKF
jgi:hydroxymethylpyrimidine pyrophosphatase-like HAD family hydrolase